MKLIAALLAFVSIAVSAETITLSATGGTGGERQYYNVGNSAGIAPLNIIRSAVSPFAEQFTLVLGPLTCSGIVTNALSQTLSCSDGTWAITTIDDDRACTKKSSGRVSRCVAWVWTLNGGTVERP